MLAFQPSLCFLALYYYCGFQKMDLNSPLKSLTELSLQQLYMQLYSNLGYSMPTCTKVNENRLHLMEKVSGHCHEGSDKSSTLCEMPV